MNGWDSVSGSFVWGGSDAIKGYASELGWQSGSPEAASLALFAGHDSLSLS